MNNKIVHPSKVEYLSFEGGGGKGIAFVGALEELEILGALPVKIHSSDSQSSICTSQIKGISGSSAGAITALFLSLGATSEDIKEVIGNGINHHNKEIKISDFFDNPSTKSREVIEEESKIKNYFIPTSNTEAVIKIVEGATIGICSFFAGAATLAVGKAILPNKLTSLTGFSFKTISGKILKLLREILKHLVIIGFLIGTILQFIIPVYIKKNTSNKLFLKIAKNLKKYISNYGFGFGMFTGEGARDFFALGINHFLDKYWQDSLNCSIEGKIITFADLKAITKIDLVITGTNITEGKVMYFSAEKTPDFPVAEAITISMSLPAIFKPTFVRTKKYKAVPDYYGLGNDNYNGYWADGGLMNNLPMHAFDHLNGPITNCPDKSLRYLNEKMLAIRLTEPETVKNTENNSSLSILGAAFNSILNNGEAGQIRSKYEDDHTINLNTGKLTTTNFTPSPQDAKLAIKDAKKEVRAYFT